MRRIILVENNSAYRKMLGLNLEIYLGAKIIYKYNADDVINFLRKDRNIQLIVCRDVVGDERSGLKIFYYMSSNSLKIPLCLIGKEDKLSGKIEMFYESDWKKLIRHSAKALTVSAKEMADQEGTPEFYPVPARLLMSMSSTPVTVYIKKMNKEAKILISGNQPIKKSAIRSFVLKDENYLFVRTNDRVKFTQEFSKQIVNYLKDEHISVKDRLNATALAFSSAQETLKQAGIGKNATTLAHATVNSIVQVAASSHGLSDLIDILYESKDTYLYRHCLLISIICHHVISDLTWGNEEQKRKMVYAAFFHDITISSDHLCKIHSEGDLQQARLSVQEQRDVMNHALNASLLLKKFPDVPQDVESIILQHHGALNGIGFKQHEQDPRVSTMGALFLVVEEYVDYLLSMDREFFNRDNVLEKMRTAYSKGKFRKMVITLASIDS